MSVFRSACFIESVFLRYYCYHYYFLHDICFIFYFYYLLIVVVFLHLCLWPIIKP